MSENIWRNMYVSPSSMSDSKDGFEIGDLSIEVSESGNSIWFTSIGDPYDTPTLDTKYLNEFYEKLGEMVKHINSAQ